ncbi:hypothetical protein GJ688_17670 [Heliobacillus mobilis]|uniref:Uncharacterized protein n=1 Tax=Heliobacterium mobile TaxID=28064 RepID=A0A6I3SNZ0_HELMO|nr:hypothetical protein [Heliobacterium mobile]MTV50763.1 hypothetical protein [Heliobacterium mobile]
MALNAFTSGTVLDVTTMNSLISLQPFSLVYDGIPFDGKSGSGIAEFDCASYSHAIRFTTTGTTELARLELDLVKHGNGVDLTTEIRTGLMVDGTNEGTLLKSMTYPKEFMPTSRAWVSIPFDLIGLTAGAVYWLVVKKNGDAANHFHVHGETTQDAGYPCYSRATTSGAWTLESAIHFRVFSGETGELKHGLYGSGFTTMEYNSDQLTKVYRYLPPLGITAGGIRDVLTYTWSNDYLKRAV